MKPGPSKKKKNVGRKKSHGIATVLYLAGLAVFVGALALAVGFGGPRGNPAPDVIPGGSLSAVDGFYDFGRISMKAGKVFRSFRLRNNGNEPALIRKLYTS